MFAHILYFDRNRSNTNLEKYEAVLTFNAIQVAKNYKFQLHV